VLSLPNGDGSSGLGRMGVVLAQTLKPSSLQVRAAQPCSSFRLVPLVEGDRRFSTETRSARKLLRLQHLQDKLQPFPESYR
jgi:hypothetical protein